MLQDGIEPPHTALSEQRRNHLATVALPTKSTSNYHVLCFLWGLRMNSFDNRKSLPRSYPIFPRADSLLVLFVYASHLSRIGYAGQQLYYVFIKDK